MARNRRKKKVALRLETLEGKIVPSSSILSVRSWFLSSGISLPSAVPVAGKPPAKPVFGLATEQDDSPIGDNTTSFSSVTLVGQTTRGARVTVSGRSGIADSSGRFVIYDVPLELGDNELKAVATRSGLRSVYFGRISREAVGATTLVLRDEGQFLQEAAVDVELGAPSGTRTLRFELKNSFSHKDVGVPGDVLNIFLVDANDPTRVLLGSRGIASPLISISEHGSDFLQGLVRFDGHEVEIDVSDIKDTTQGKLLFQLISGDTDSGSEVHIGSVLNLVDETGTPGPRMRALPDSGMAPGGPRSFAGLTNASRVAVLIDNVRFDEVTNQLTADVRVRNDSKRTIGRNLVVLLPNIPSGVELIGSSGQTRRGVPYLNLTMAIPSGGLATGEVSGSVRIVFDNPDRLMFGLQPKVLAQPNRRPVISVIPRQKVFVGGRAEIQFKVRDWNKDEVTIRLEGKRLPSGMLRADGTLVITPGPEDVGVYNLTVVADDGSTTTRRKFRVVALANPILSTRVSGRVLDVTGEPIVGIEVEVGAVVGLTSADGGFLLDLGPGLPPTQTLKIRGELLEGSVSYPFLAEKLPLLLDHEIYPLANNVISRPIYLPKLDTANAVQIDPSVETHVTTLAIPGIDLTIAPGSLLTQVGSPYTGAVSITEVPPELTPAALPKNLRPDTVVTIQPGEMTFATPAPLSFPNRAGYAPGTVMDLWSINPSTGEFDDVGDMVVTEDGNSIVTTSGGVRNSSWHMPAPQPNQRDDPNKDPKNEDNSCDECKQTAGATSEVELHSGALRESHALVTYQSLGQTRGLTLNYDSVRADPRPILTFGYSDVQSRNDDRLVAGLTVRRDGFDYQVPGVAAGTEGLNAGEHVWRMDSFGNVRVALQADLRDFPTGEYSYVLSGGILTTGGGSFNGTTTTDTGTFQIVNGRDSVFGVGWGLGGLEQIVVNSDGSLLLIDGSGGELRFGTPTSAGESYVSPPGDFSTLTRTGDGYVRIFKDQSVQRFNVDGQLVSLRDRNKNETKYEYNAFGISKITDPVGLETKLSYSNGRVSRITDPAGRSTVLAYDTAGNLKSVTDPDGAKRTWSYDDKSHMTGEVDARGLTESAEYDFAGRVVRAVTKDAQILNFSPVQTQQLYPAAKTADPASEAGLFDNGPPVSTHTDANGNTVETILDQAGQAKQASDGVGGTGQVFRDMRNQVVVSRDARDNATGYERDDFGNVLSVTDQGGGLDPEVPGGEGFPLRRYNPSADWVVGLKTPAAVDDFTGDGIPDLLFTGPIPEGGGDEAVLLVGEVGGGFSAPVRSPIPVESIFLVGDVNEDGKRDLIGPSSVQLGQASGFFATGPEILPRSDHQRFLADVDGDQHLDIVLTEFTETEVLTSWLRGTGNATFPDYFPLLPATGVYLLQVEDLTGDGVAEVIGFRQPNAQGSTPLSVWINDGQGGFTESIVALLPGSPLDAVVGDFTNDGRRDLAVTWQQGESPKQLTLLDQESNGSFSERPPIGTGVYYGNVLATDADRDGNLDIFFGSKKLFLGDGTGNFASIDLFGQNDIVPDQIVAFGSPASYFHVSPDISEPFITPLGAYADYFGFPPLTAYLPFGPHVGDFNGDGILDYIAVSDLPSGRAIDLFRGVEGGTFILSGTVELTGAVGPIGSLRMTDLDGDEDDDIFALSKGNQDVEAITLLGDGFGGFGPPQESYLLSSPNAQFEQYRQPTLIDINGDQNLDFIAQREDQAYSVWLADGPGTFADRQTLEIPLGGGDLSQFLTGDFNGDGFVDLIGRQSPPSDKLHLWPGTATGIFGNRVQINTPTIGIESFAAIDANGDDIFDLVVLATTDTTPALITLLGTGNGQFAEIYRLMLPTAFYTSFVSGILDARFTIEDLNSDGKMDLAYSTLDGLALFTGDGFGGFRVDYHLTPGMSQLAAVTTTEGPALLVSGSSSHIYRLQTSGGGGGGGNGSTEAVRRMTYDPIFNQLTSMTDEQGNSTNYELDPVTGNVLAQTRVVGTPGGSDDLVTRYMYTQSGLVATMIDPQERTTKYEYDAKGRLIKVTSLFGTPNATSRFFDHDAAGNQISVIDENGHETRFMYDKMNRLVRTIEADPDGNGPLAAPVSLYSYDGNGNMIRATDAQGNVSLTEFDARDRVIRSIQPDPDGAGPLLASVTRYSYDKAGNVASVTDPLNQVTLHRYDARNRRIATIDPDGGITRFAYDLDNNLTRVADPGGNVTRFEYDVRDRLIEETDPLGKSIDYAYDGANNLVSKTDRNGRTTRFQYDDLNRLKQETWVDASGTTVNIIAYGYDKVGNLLSVSDVSSSLTMSYDDRNRIKTVSNAGTPGTPAVTLEYEYDDHGNVTEVKDTIDGVAGATTSYIYDELHRLTDLSQTGNGVTPKAVAFGYNTLGQYTRISRTSESNPVIETTFAYDGMNRLIDLTHRTGVTPVAGYAYTYDTDSRITSIDSLRDGLVNYSYDDRDQLTGADYADSAIPDELYRYDANGNRLESHLHGTGYETDPNTANRLRTDGTFDYEYDYEGNLTKRTEIATGAFRVFEWDNRNRLVRVTDSTAATEITQNVTFTYDALNRRLSKTVDGTDTLRFVYDREDVLFDFVDEDGNDPELAEMTVRYLHGSGIDQVLAEDLGAGEVRWLLADHLGTIREIVSTDPDMLSHVILDTYGNVLFETSDSGRTRYTFTGRELDTETGLHYYRARYYDPRVGLFTTSDPIGLGSGINTYQYALNRPNWFIDPLGTDVYVSSPGGGMPGHQNVVVGNVAYSFGIAPPWYDPFQAFLGHGDIYRDERGVGDPVDSRYLKTSKEEDALIQQIIELGRSKGAFKNWYSALTTNCRWVSDDLFDAIRDYLNSRRSIPGPQRPVPFTAKEADSP